MLSPAYPEQPSYRLNVNFAAPGAISSAMLSFHSICSTRRSLRQVLDETNLAQVLSGELPAHVRKLNEAPDAWLSR